MCKRSWQEIATEVQEHRESTIAKVRPQNYQVPGNLPLNVTSIPKAVLSSREIEITQSAADLLIASLGTGRLTSTEVANAFLRRAALAQDLVSRLNIHIL